MNTHLLRGRTEREVSWFQRRSFLQAAAAWSALGATSCALAQPRSQIVELMGDVLLNHRRLEPGSIIRSGDVIRTGPGSTLIFVIGDCAFHLRQNSQLTVEYGPASSQVLSALRLLTGAIVSVWGKGTRRQLITPSATIGIRGTGTYTEIPSDQADRTYFCNCYGIVDLRSGTERRVSESEYHQAFWAESSPQDGKHLTAAKLLNHSDEEVEQLARLANQPTAWQITGRKGTKSDYQ